MPLTIDIVNRSNDSIKIYLIGRLDTNTASQLEEILATKLQKDIRLLTLDLLGLDYISSAGLRVLFRASKALKKQDGHLGLMHLQPQIQKVLDIIKILPEVPVFDGEKEMDEYLDAIQKQITEKNN